MLAYESALRFIKHALSCNQVTKNLELEKEIERLTIENAILKDRIHQFETAELNDSIGEANH